MPLFTIHIHSTTPLHSTHTDSSPTQGPLSFSLLEKAPRGIWRERKCSHSLNATATATGAIPCLAEHFIYKKYYGIIMGSLSSSHGSCCYSNSNSFFHLFTSDRYNGGMWLPPKRNYLIYVGMPGKKTIFQTGR